MCEDHRTGHISPVNYLSFAIYWVMFFSTFDTAKGKVTITSRMPIILARRHCKRNTTLKIFMINNIRGNSYIADNEVATGIFFFLWFNFCSTHFGFRTRLMNIRKLLCKHLGPLFVGFSSRVFLCFHIGRTYFAVILQRLAISHKPQFVAYDEYQSCR